MYCFYIIISVIQTVLLYLSLQRFSCSQMYNHMYLCILLIHLYTEINILEVLVLQKI